MLEEIAIIERRVGKKFCQLTFTELGFAVKTSKIKTNIWCKFFKRRRSIMKKILLTALASLSIISLVAFFGFYSTAKSFNFEEKFLAGGNVSEKGESGVYNFDKAHSSIGFYVRHMGLVDVPGHFRDFTGKINYDDGDITKSSVEFSAKVTSIDTGVAGRDNHLRSKDFFEVETYPEMTFKSTKIEKKGKELMMTGDLTIKGVTKSVSFPFSVVGFVKEQRGTRMGAVAETKINRRDFGITYGNKLPNGTPSIGDEVRVVLNIEAVLPATQPAKTQ